MTDKKYEFPDCLHYLGAAFHMQGISPQDVRIILPHDDWWKLRCALESAYWGLLRYDGRGSLNLEFRYNGFHFVSDQQREKQVAKAA